jgi:Holliday junction resolvase RusA-like endonuclease
VTVYTFPGEPVPKGRPRHDQGRWHTPTRTENAEKAIRWELKAQHAKLTGEPVRVELDFRCKSQTADLDNLVKLVLDACQGFLWANDKQVCQISAEVERGVSDPKTILHVVERPDEELQEWEVTLGDGLDEA